MCVAVCGAVCVIAHVARRQVSPQVYVCVVCVAVCVAVCAAAHVARRQVSPQVYMPCYGVATIRRLLKNIGLFCKRAL